MIAFADAGITTFDCADIYTGVEELIGGSACAIAMLRGERGARRGSRCTPSSCPTSTSCRASPRAYVEGVVDQSLRRLKLERLDLVQFHWWDYAVPRWLETAHLAGRAAARRQDRQVGGTNFDTEHMLAMVESGVPLTSMQVQYSLLDAGRPSAWSTAAARARRLAALLRHGRGRLPRATAGSARRSRQARFENRSLTKYKLIIDDFGGWDAVPGSARRRCARSPTATAATSPPSPARRC